VSHCGEGARGDRREGDGGDNKSLPPPERRQLYNEGVIKSAEGEKKETTQTQ